MHSPFVYQLVDEVIYNRKPNSIYDSIEAVRNTLLEDDRTINITDLGAGSHVNNNRQKRLATLPATPLNRPFGPAFIPLAAFMQPRNITELGTCLGITTLYLKAPRLMQR